MVGSDLLPSVAAIARSVHAIQGARYDGLWIGGRDLKRANGHTAHTLQGFPRLSAISGTENLASFVVNHAPCGNVDPVRIGWIDSDIVEDVIVTRAEMDVTHPTGATVHRKKKLAGAGAKEYAVRIMRIVGKTADITAVRPMRLPLISGKHRGYEKERER